MTFFAQFLIFYWKKNYILFLWQSSFWLYRKCYRNCNKNSIKTYVFHMQNRKYVFWLLSMILRFRQKGNQSFVNTWMSVWELLNGLKTTAMVIIHTYHTQKKIKVLLYIKYLIMRIIMKKKWYAYMYLMYIINHVKIKLWFLF